MTENEAPREDKAQEESGSEDEGPNWEERPDSPEPGHPAGETQPIGGVPPRVHEEPQDIPDRDPRQPSGPRVGLARTDSLFALQASLAAAGAPGARGRARSWP
jgi:hypothetical protein